jgi:hypothetical protein
LTLPVKSKSDDYKKAIFRRFEEELPQKHHSGQLDVDEEPEIYSAHSTLKIPEECFTGERRLPTLIK